MLCCLAAVGGALWLLGVRDWRCYALSAAFPATASAVDLGTVAPFLLLAVAAAWRWRGRTAGASAATAAAIALKVFLWPLLAWLAFTRRFRTGAVAIAATAALVFLPWAVIAFAGLADYPALLRRLSDEEATSSYPGGRPGGACAPSRRRSASSFHWRRLRCSALPPGSRATNECRCATAIPPRSRSHWPRRLGVADRLDSLLPLADRPNCSH
jgi:hypothetical protein